MQIDIDELLRSLRRLRIDEQYLAALDTADTLADAPRPVVALNRSAVADKLNHLIVAPCTSSECSANRPTTRRPVNCGASGRRS